MSQVAPLPSAQAPAAPNGVASLSGRINSFRRVAGQNGSVWLTILKMPAADEFSSPQTVELTSAEKLGDRGEPWKGRVQIGGFGRVYDSTDKHTGEVSKVQTANIRLTVI